MEHECLAQLVRTWQETEHSDSPHYAGGGKFPSVKMPWSVCMCAQMVLQSSQSSDYYAGVVMFTSLHR